MFIKTKTPLINANWVPLTFGANSAALLAPGSAAASRVWPWRQFHGWLHCLLLCLACSACCSSRHALLAAWQTTCLHASTIPGLQKCTNNVQMVYKNVQIMFKWFTNHSDATTL